MRSTVCRMPPLALLPFALYLLPFAFPPLLAQEPYATIDRDSVTYRGPGRDAGHDVAGAEVRIGLLAPLSGPRRAEGEELRNAAQLAIDDDNAASLPGGRRLALVTRDENGPWGQAASQIVQMVYDDGALALITSTEGGSAHLAEQVGNKVGVPILTLASDATTTEINLPWIFRLGPNDAAQAELFARDIYKTRKLQHVLLLTQSDHDGRVGGDAFAKTARDLGASNPVRVTVESGASKWQPSGADQDFQAIVIWSDAAAAGELVPQLRAAASTVPIYVCGKAARSSGPVMAQIGADLTVAPQCRACEAGDIELWTAEAIEGQTAALAHFEQRYQQRFGSQPGRGAAQAYDAVRVVAASLRQSGPNRARLRDSLASTHRYLGLSGTVTFDHAGNDTAEVTLVRFHF